MGTEIVREGDAEVVGRVPTGVRPPVSRSPRPAPPEFVEGSFLVRFARTEGDVRAVQRLRYEVFNLELQEGLEESHRIGLDQDRFDEVCDHLMVIDRRADRLIGTYRLQTWSRAAEGLGFYGADEFALEAVPPAILHRSIELGRACIERGHRHGHALFALWRGLAAYAAWTGQRYLLGCCSLTSQDPRDGVRMLRHLTDGGYLHPDFTVPALPALDCLRLAGAEGDGETTPVAVPKLFGTYLRYGALVCGPPALDRAFGTIDFLVLLDLENLTPRVRQLFFAGLPEGGR